VYLIRNGRLFQQHEVDPDNPIPVGWVHESFHPAEVSGPGWIPVRTMRWDEDLADGVYEMKDSKLCPAQQGNLIKP